MELLKKLINTREKKASLSKQALAPLKDSNNQKDYLSLIWSQVTGSSNSDPKRVFLRVSDEFE